jgi:hypothetical protein
METVVNSKPVSQVEPIARAIMLVAKEGSGPPEWVPDYIAKKARELRDKHSGNPIALAVIERLTTHPNMRTVWKELSKQSREKHQRTGRPLHKLTERFATDRNAALANLFEFACNIGRLTLSLPSPHKPERIYKALAQRLRDETKRLTNDPFAKGIREHLLWLARRCEAITASGHDPSETIAVEMATYLKEVFGSSMHKITAIIASVITGAEINQRRVRTLLKNPYR